MDLHQLYEERKMQAEKELAEKKARADKEWAAKFQAGGRIEELKDTARAYLGYIGEGIQRGPQTVQHPSEPPEDYTYLERNFALDTIERLLNYSSSWKQSEYLKKLYILSIDILQSELLKEEKV